LGNSGDINTRKIVVSYRFRVLHLNHVQRFPYTAQVRPWAHRSSLGRCRMPQITTTNTRHGSVLQAMQWRVCLELGN